MPVFAHAHASDAQWQRACERVLAQLRGQLEGSATAATLALLYVTDHYADVAQQVLEHLSAALPWVTDWAGTVGLGIVADGQSYWDEPALALLLLDLPSDQYRVFSGVAPLSLGFEPHSALVHADPQTPDVAELVAEMAQRTATGTVFGGLASSRGRCIQFACAADGTVRGQGRSSGVFSGGLSGVAFGAGVALVTRLSQGCAPVAPLRCVTQARGNLVTALDGRPAMDVLLQDLAITLEQPEQAVAVLRSTLVGLQPQLSRGVSGTLAADMTVRPLIGLDPLRHGVAVGAEVHAGMGFMLCQNQAQAVRAELLRVGTEIREEAESGQPQRRPMLGAVYISCLARADTVADEVQQLRRALGPQLPLIGFSAAGEIHGRQLHAHSGVLAVFLGPAGR